MEWGREKKLCNVQSEKVKLSKHIPPSPTWQNCPSLNFSVDGVIFGEAHRDQASARTSANSHYGFTHAYHCGDCDDPRVLRDLGRKNMEGSPHNNLLIDHVTTLSLSDDAKNSSSQGWIACAYN